MSKPIEDILAPRPQARPRIYAYSIADAAHAGLLKVGQTTRDVYVFVPDLPLDQEWTDAKLYQRYGLTSDEIAFIESMIRPIEPNGEETT
jgi:hypothetical protein